MRRRRALSGACAVAALAVVLSACNGVGGGTGANGASGRAELATASDQTSSQKRADIRMQLAAGYYQNGQYDVALDQVKLALQSTPDNAELYGLRALIYMAMNEVALANDNFQRALQLAPRNPDVNSNYGLYLCQNGRGKEAFPYFDAALGVRNYPTPENVYNNAGGCAVGLKDYARAESYLLRAESLTPDRPATVVNMARLYYAKGDYARAATYINRLNKVIKLDGLSADVLWLAVRVQHKVDDTAAEAGWATLLRRHHAKSTEYAAYQRGAFDE